jgi:hypothetical protein
VTGEPELRDYESFGQVVSYVALPCDKIAVEVPYRVAAHRRGHADIRINLRSGHFSDPIFLTVFQLVSDANATRRRDQVRKMGSEKSKGNHF